MSMEKWQPDSFVAYGNVAKEVIDILQAPYHPCPLYTQIVTGEVDLGMELGEPRVPDRARAKLEDAARQIDKPKQILEDWLVIYECEVLRGLGTELPYQFSGRELEGAKSLATVWGTILAQQLGQVLTGFETTEAAAETLIAVVQQLPDRLVGELFAEVVTPGFIKEQALLRYALAAYWGDNAEARKAKDMLDADDADLQREIERSVGGNSTCDLGQWFKGITMRTLTLLLDLCRGTEFEAEIRRVLPRAFGAVAFNVGCRLGYIISNNPAKGRAILEALSDRKIEVVIEQFKYKYGWGGDPNRATTLAWEEFGPRAIRCHRWDLPRAERIKNPPQ